MDTATAKHAVGFWDKTKGYRGHLFVAFIFDLLSMIPWVGMIFSFLGYATLWLWFEIDGINPSLFSGRKKAKKAASFVGEWIAGVLGFGIVPGIMMWAYFAASEHAETESENKQAALEKIQKELKTRNRQANKVNRQKRRVQTSAYQ